MLRNILDKNKLQLIIWCFVWNSLQYYSKRNPPWVKVSTFAFCFGEGRCKVNDFNFSPSVNDYCAFSMRFFTEGKMYAASI